jgi:Stress responsive A/B Barrel Domain
MVPLMISHLVLMKPRVDLSAVDRQAFMAAFEHALREIPTIRGVRIGKRITHGAAYEQTSPDAADFFAAIDFDDLAGLQAYLRHPAHDELGARFGQSLSAALVYDFEAAGIEELRRGFSSRDADD